MNDPKMTRRAKEFLSEPAEETIPLVVAAGSAVAIGREFKVDNDCAVVVPSKFANNCAAAVLYKFSFSVIVDGSSQKGSSVVISGELVVKVGSAVVTASAVQEVVLVKLGSAVAVEGALGGDVVKVGSLVAVGAVQDVVLVKLGSAVAVEVALELLVK